MDPEELLKKSQNPNFIAGIYNYCDRWCEKCAFTSKCLNHELTSELEKNMSTLDIQNHDFWANMKGVYESTRDFIQDVIEKKGKNLNDADTNEIIDEIKKDEHEQERAIHQPVSLMAHEYVQLADTFFLNENNFFQQKEDEFNDQLDLGLNEQKIESTATEIKDSFEIIKWHKDQIYVKTIRALTGRNDPEIWFDITGYQHDSDGSAKVALIGIDRSMEAWGKLQQLFPEKTDEFITILFHLEKLKNQLENEFPGARTFQRPGFDVKVNPSET